MIDGIYNAVLKEMIFNNQFVCPHSNPDFYDFLAQEHNLQQVNDYLSVIHRIVRQTGQGDVFYCCYLYPTDKDYKSATRSLYNQLINNLNPFLKLITSLMSLNSGTPIRAGDILQESRLLSGFEQSKAHGETLAELTRSGLFYSTSAHTKGQLNQVLKKLVEEKYLINHGDTGLQYRATGKWSMLYDFIDFQYANEFIADDDDSEQLSFPT